jgi:hypothetical protein
MSSDEDLLHDQFADELEAGARPPLGDLVARSTAEGQRKRRHRMAAGASLGMVGALAVAGVVRLAPSSHGAGLDAAQTAAAGTVPTSTTAAPPPTSPVRIVTPGTIDIGQGFKMTLTTHSVTVTDGTGRETMTRNTDDGIQPENSIRYQLWGSPDSPNLAGGLYIGDGEVASAVFSWHGHTYPGTIVTLAGHPGWCEVYAPLPVNSIVPDTGQPTGTATYWTVYDAEGQVLATEVAPAN